MARIVFIPNKGFHNWEPTSRQLKDRTGLYYEVTCTTCGMLGFQRDPLGVHVMSTNKKQTREYCKSAPAKVPRVMLRGDRIGEYGLTVGDIVEAVPCPLEHEEDFEKEVWVFSEKRNEAVMLLHYEYKIV